MSDLPLSWRLRKRFWAHWETFRFALSKPKTIGQPDGDEREIKLHPFKELYPGIPLQNIPVFDRLPGVENNLGMKAIVGLGLFFERVYPQMQAGLPEIDPDPKVAVNQGLEAVYKDAYRIPVRPKYYDVEGAPNLGDLAMEGPYCLFIERESEDELKWDFSFMGDYEHHPGLRSLAVKVIFNDPKRQGRPQALRIISKEYGEVHNPGPDSSDDAQKKLWNDSALLAICAATTHTALTRHFNYVHLISGNHWDVVTRNKLPSRHAIHHLLWPQIYDSCYTNYGVTRVQMEPNGDFVNMFSYTHRGLMKFFDDMYEIYHCSMMNPREDWTKRGLDSAIDIDDAPSHENLVELYDLMYVHARRYIYHYYKSDKALREDPFVADWLEELNRIIPNGIPGALLGNKLDRDRLAHFIGGYIYESNTIHEIAGTNLWDYQLWTDKNPIRIYSNGQRLPRDIFQRAINNNFALQLERDPLCFDYRDVAKDEAGRKLFTQFCVDCRRLQVDYDLERWDSGDHPIWRMEPRNLNIGMNG